VRNSEKFENNTCGKGMYGTFRKRNGVKIQELSSWFEKGMV